MTSERMRRYRDRKLKEEFRGEVGCATFWLGCISLVLIGYGITAIDSFLGAATLVAGASCAGLTWGLYRRRPGVRWPAAIVFAVFGASGVFSLFDPEYSFARDHLSTTHAAVFLITAIFLALPSTRRRFFDRPEEDQEEERDPGPG